MRFVVGFSSKDSNIANWNWNGAKSHTLFFSLYRGHYIFVVLTVGFRSVKITWKCNPRIGVNLRKARLTIAVRTDAYIAGDLVLYAWYAHSPRDAIMYLTGSMLYECAVQYFIRQNVKRWHKTNVEYIPHCTLFWCQI